MNKWHKYCSIAATSVATIGLIIVPAIVPAAKNSYNNVYNPNNGNNIKPQQFDQNWQEYNDKLTPSGAPIIFNDDFKEYQPWMKLSTDANDPIYKNLFNKIDLKLISNDIYQFISTTLRNNKTSSIELNVTDIEGLYNPNSNINPTNTITPRTTAFINPTVYNFKIKFKMYNNNPVAKMYQIKNNQQTININFAPYEIKNQTIEINSQAYPDFYITTDPKTNTSNLYANYYFKDALWTIDNTQHVINKFSWANSSYSLNTVIQGVNTNKSYLDIAQQANAALKTLTSTDINNDINNTFENYYHLVTPFLDPIQNILQALAKNPTTKEFLNNEATDIGKLVDLSLNMSNKSIENIDKLIEAILKDQTIYQIMTNHDLSIPLYQIIELVVPGSGDTVQSILNGMSFNSQEEFDEAFDLIISKGSELVGPNIDLSFLNDLKTEGLLSFIVKNSSNIKNILTNFGISSPLIDDIFLLIDPNTMDTPIINVLINAINKTDEANKKVLPSLLKPVFDTLPPIVGELVNSLVFNNTNLNVNHLMSAFNALGNPTNAPVKGSSINPNSVIRYRDWFEKTWTNKTISLNNTFNKDTLSVNLNTEAKFIYPETLNIYTRGLVGLLPNSITINGKTIPLNIAGIGINTVWPDNFTLNKNESFSLLLNSTNTSLEYDVVKDQTNDKDVLSWKALTKFSYITNMPTTVKQIWDKCSSGTGDFVLASFGNLLFHKFNETKYFYPSTSVLNKTEIKNYSADAKNNIGVTTKTLTPERIQAISNAINIANKEKNVSNKPFLINKGSFFIPRKEIWQSETINSFDVKPLIDELLDLTYFPAERLNDFKIYLNSNLVVNTSKLMQTITVPKVTVNNLVISLPYNVTSNNGVMQSSWSFSF